LVARGGCPASFEERISIEAIDETVLRPTQFGYNGTIEGRGFARNGCTDPANDRLSS
jgi:hypothetical protein